MGLTTIMQEDHVPPTCRDPDPISDHLRRNILPVSALQRPAQDLHPRPSSERDAGPVHLPVRGTEHRREDPSSSVESPGGTLELSSLRDRVKLREVHMVPTVRSDHVTLLDHPHKKVLTPSDLGSSHEEDRRRSELPENIQERLRHRTLRTIIEREDHPTMGGLEKRRQDPHQTSR